MYKNVPEQRLIKIWGLQPDRKATKNGSAPLFKIHLLIHVLKPFMMSQRELQQHGYLLQAAEINTMQVFWPVRPPLNSISVWKLSEPNKLIDLLRQEYVVWEPVYEGHIYTVSQEPLEASGWAVLSGLLLHWRLKIVNGRIELGMQQKELRDFYFLRPEWLLWFPFCEITERLHACRSVRETVITIIFLRAISLILQFANFL